MYIEKIEKGGVQWKYHYDDVDESSMLAQTAITDDTTLGEVFLGAKRISPTTNGLSYIGTDAITDHEDGEGRCHTGLHHQDESGPL